MMATMNNYLSLIPTLTHLWHQYGPEPPFAGLKLNYTESPTGLIRTVYQPSLCVVLQGSKKSILGEYSYHYRAGQCLFASADVPVTAHILEASSDQPYMAFSLAIDPHMVTEVLLQHQLKIRQESVYSALQTVSLPALLIEPLHRLLQLVGNEYDGPVLRPLIEREIIWRLLNSDLKEPLCQLGLYDSHHSKVGLVTKWIRDHYNQTRPVAELAAMANMSVPSFHRHFKTVTQMTPLQFQKQIRLHEARRKLALELDIAEIAYSVGYESPSQFSREYRKYFGVSPFQDRQELKAQTM